MNEEEWRECLEPAKMLEYLWLRNQVPDRKLWLYRAVCCRRTLHLADHASVCEAVGLAESIAEGDLTVVSILDVHSRIDGGGVDATQVAARQAASALLEWYVDPNSLGVALENAIHAVGCEV